jgi:hypothetical protein
MGLVKPASGSATYEEECQLLPPLFESGNGSCFSQANYSPDEFAENLEMGVIPKHAHPHISRNLEKSLLCFC